MNTFGERPGDRYSDGIKGVYELIEDLGVVHIHKGLSAHTLYFFLNSSPDLKDSYLNLSRSQIDLTNEEIEQLREKTLQFIKNSLTQISEKPGQIHTTAPVMTQGNKLFSNRVRDLQKQTQASIDGRLFRLPFREIVKEFSHIIQEIETTVAALQNSLKDEMQKLLSEVNQKINVIRNEANLLNEEALMEIIASITQLQTGVLGLIEKLRSMEEKDHFFREAKLISETFSAVLIEYITKKNRPEVESLKKRNTEISGYYQDKNEIKKNQDKIGELEIDLASLQKLPKNQLIQTVLLNKQRIHSIRSSVEKLENDFNEVNTSVKNLLNKELGLSDSLEEIKRKTQQLGEKLNLEKSIQVQENLLKQISVKFDKSFEKKFKKEGLESLKSVLEKKLKPVELSIQTIEASVNYFLIKEKALQKAQEYNAFIKQYETAGYQFKLLDEFKKTIKKLIDKANNPIEEGAETHRFLRRQKRLSASLEKTQLKVEKLTVEINQYIESFKKACLDLKSTLEEAEKYLCEDVQLRKVEGSASRLKEEMHQIYKKDVLENQIKKPLIDLISSAQQILQSADTHTLKFDGVSPLYKTLKEQLALSKNHVDYFQKEVDDLKEIENAHDQIQRYRERLINFEMQASSILSKKQAKNDYLNVIQQFKVHVDSFEQEVNDLVKKKGMHFQEGAPIKEEITHVSAKKYEEIGKVIHQLKEMIKHEKACENRFEKEIRAIWKMLGINKSNFELKRARLKKLEEDGRGQFVSMPCSMIEEIYHAVRALAASKLGWTSEEMLAREIDPNKLNEIFNKFKEKLQREEELDDFKERMKKEAIKNGTWNLEDESEVTQPREWNVKELESKHFDRNKLILAVLKDETEKVEFKIRCQEMVVLGSELSGKSKELHRLLKKVDKLSKNVVPSEMYETTRLIDCEFQAIYNMVEQGARFEFAKHNESLQTYYQSLLEVRTHYQDQIEKVKRFGRDVFDVELKGFLNGIKQEKETILSIGKELTAIPYHISQTAHIIELNEIIALLESIDLNELTEIDQLQKARTVYKEAQFFKNLVALLPTLEVRFNQLQQRNTLLKKLGIQTKELRRNERNLQTILKDLTSLLSQKEEEETYSFKPYEKILNLFNLFYEKAMVHEKLCQQLLSNKRNFLSDEISFAAEQLCKSSEQLYSPSLKKQFLSLNEAIRSVNFHDNLEEGEKLLNLEQIYQHAMTSVKNEFLASQEKMFQSVGNEHQLLKKYFKEFDARDLIQDLEHLKDQAKASLNKIKQIPESQNVQAFFEDLVICEQLQTAYEKGCRQVSTLKLNENLSLGQTSLLDNFNEYIQHQAPSIDPLLKDQADICSTELKKLIKTVNKASKDEVGSDYLTAFEVIRCKMLSIQCAVESGIENTKIQQIVKDHQENLRNSAPYKALENKFAHLQNALVSRENKINDEMSTLILKLNKIKNLLKLERNSKNLDNNYQKELSTEAVSLKQEIDALEEKRLEDVAILSIRKKIKAIKDYFNAFNHAKTLEEVYTSVNTLKTNSIFDERTTFHLIKKSTRQVVDSLADFSKTHWDKIEYDATCSLNKLKTPKKEFIAKRVPTNRYVNRKWEFIWEIEEKLPEIPGQWFKNDAYRNFALHYKTRLNEIKKLLKALDSSLNKGRGLDFVQISKDVIEKMTSYQNEVKTEIAKFEARNAVEKIKLEISPQNIEVLNSWGVNAQKGEKLLSEIEALEVQLKGLIEENDLSYTLDEKLHIFKTKVEEFNCEIEAEKRKIEDIELINNFILNLKKPETFSQFPEAYKKDVNLTVAKELQTLFEEIEKESDLLSNYIGNREALEQAKINISGYVENYNKVVLDECNRLQKNEENKLHNRIRRSINSIGKSIDNTITDFKENREKAEIENAIEKYNGAIDQQVALVEQEIKDLEYEKTQKELSLVMRSVLDQQIIALKDYLLSFLNEKINHVESPGSGSPINTFKLKERTIGFQNIVIAKNGTNRIKDRLIAEIGALKEGRNEKNFYNITHLIQLENKVKSFGKEKTIPSLVSKAKELFSDLANVKAQQYTFVQTLAKKKVLVKNAFASFTTPFRLTSEKLDKLKVRFESEKKLMLPEHERKIRDKIKRLSNKLVEMNASAEEAKKKFFIEIKENEHLDAHPTAEVLKTLVNKVNQLNFDVVDNELPAQMKEFSEDARIYVDGVIKGFTTVLQEQADRLRNSLNGAYKANQLEGIIQCIKDKRLLSEWLKHEKDAIWVINTEDETEVDKNRLFNYLLYGHLGRDEDKPWQTLNSILNERRIYSFFRKGVITSLNEINAFIDNAVQEQVGAGFTPSEERGVINNKFEEDYFDYIFN